jgi:2-polyprenyl-3-methyl-5-hydroxy-6-metoxy-1,4-benzoquinol methylase
MKYYSAESEAPHISLSTVQKEAREKLLRHFSHERKENFFCPICDHTKFRHCFNEDKYGLPLRSGFCQNCGAFQTINKPSPELLDIFYSQFYGTLYKGKEDFDVRRFNLQIARGEELHRFLERAEQYGINVPPKFIEIGCSSGGILKKLQDHGREGQGFDIDEKALLFGCEKMGVPNIHHGDGLENLMQEKTPKLIILSHFLEHVRDPKIFMQQVSTYLGKGLCYIEVPNLAGALLNKKPHFQGHLEIAHLYFFTPKSMKNLLRRTGLSIAFIENGPNIKILAKKCGNTDNNFEIHLSYDRSGIRALHCFRLVELIFPKFLLEYRFFSRLRNYFCRVIFHTFFNRI